MDFIERFFGLSPDNGDGSTELMWCIALAAVLVVTFYVHQRHRRARRTLR